MRFSNFFHKNVITESPDRIFTKNNGVENYDDASIGNYSFFILANTGGVLMREDDNIVRGHHAFASALRMMDIAQLEDAYIEGDIDEIQPMLTQTNLRNRGRIWTKENRVSFWLPYNTSMVQPIIRMFKIIGKKPDKYIFEFNGEDYIPDGNTQKTIDPDDAEQEAIMTWEEVKTGNKNYSDKYNNAQKERDLRRMEDERLLAKLNMKQYQYRDGD